MLAVVQNVQAHMTEGLHICAYAIGVGSHEFNGYAHVRAGGPE